MLAWLIVIWTNEIYGNFANSVFFEFRGCRSCYYLRIYSLHSSAFGQIMFHNSRLKDWSLFDNCFFIEASERFSTQERGETSAKPFFLLWFNGCRIYFVGFHLVCTP